MKVSVACDHAGFLLKEVVIRATRILGHEVVDLGTNSTEPVDYPDYAFKVGIAIQEKKAHRGILLCGSGVGASIAANKMLGVYAGVCHDTYSARQCVEHDNVNTLCIGARVVGSELAIEIVNTFLAASYLGLDPGHDRYERRVAKIADFEKLHMK